MCRRISGGKLVLLSVSVHFASCLFCKSAYMYLLRLKFSMLNNVYEIDLTRMSLLPHLQICLSVFYKRKYCHKKRTCICLSEDFTVLDLSIHILTDRLTKVSCNALANIK